MSATSGPAEALPLGGFHQAHATGRTACFEALIGFLLLFGGDYRLTPVAAFPDPGSRDEFGAATAALFRHRLLEGENTGLLGQQMGIVEIAMIHVSAPF